MCTKLDDYYRGAPVLRPLHLDNTINIVSVSKFNEDERTITINLNVELKWDDERLKIKTPNESV